MRVEGSRITNLISVPSVARNPRLERLVSYILFGLGLLFLLASMTYAINSLLKSWLIGQDRYLVAEDLAPLPVVTMSWMALSRDTTTPTQPVAPLLSPTLAATPTLVPGMTSFPRSVEPVASLPSESSMPTSTPTATSWPSATAMATDSPRVESAAPPVKVRIPSLDVKRSVIPLPRQRDRHTGAWTWNTKKLFRSGRKDLVGHSEGSANPGEAGNMILVGHNYGYGHNGVFVRLNRLKPGRSVIVFNSAGETFTYRVTTVKKVKWRRKNFGELTQHLSFLASGGPERLTLVSCSGADVEPFPERIYVVAEPVR